MHTCPFCYKSCVLVVGLLQLEQFLALEPFVSMRASVNQSFMKWIPKAILKDFSCLKKWFMIDLSDNLFQWNSFLLQRSQDQEASTILGPGCVQKWMDAWTTSMHVLNEGNAQELLLRNSDFCSLFGLDTNVCSILVKRNAKTWETLHGYAKLCSTKKDHQERSEMLYLYCSHYNAIKSWEKEIR